MAVAYCCTHSSASAYAVLNSATAHVQNHSKFGVAEPPVLCVVSLCSFFLQLLPNFRLGSTAFRSASLHAPPLSAPSGFDSAQNQQRQLVTGWCGCLLLFSPEEKQIPELSVRAPCLQIGGATHAYMGGGGRHLRSSATLPA